MAINLSRNTRVFVSTETIAAQAAVNTWEIPVIDGYSFSQDTETQTIGLSEAGCTPQRGQKTFNTALNPVEVSFPTYVKPVKDTTNTNCVENILWQAFSSNLKTAASAAAPLVFDFLGSNVNSLTELTIYFQLDNTTYAVEKVQLNTAEVDFDITAISMVTWTGNGTEISEVDTSNWVAVTNYTAAATGQFIRNKLSTVKLWKNSEGASNGEQSINYNNALTGATVTTAAAATYTADVVVDTVSNPVSVDLVGTEDIDAILVLINTDLTGATATLEGGNIVVTSASTGVASTIAITDTDLFANIYTAEYRCVDAPLDGVAAGKQYFIPITGGSLTLDNSIEYLTPEELGVVNIPIGGFTGSRNFAGSLTAYLNNCDQASGGLFKDLLADVSNVSNRYDLRIEVGGCAGGTGPEVHFKMPYAQISIPTIQTEDVIATEIAFNAQGSDITKSDELTVTYIADVS